MYEIPFEKFEILNLIGAEKIEIFGNVWHRYLHEIVMASEVAAYMEMTTDDGKPMFEVIRKGGRID